MQHTFGPPSFLTGQTSCPKCSSPVRDDEQSAVCPVCFTAHHRRCVHEGVTCGNRGCDYHFLFSDGMAVSEAWDGPERRDKSDRRQQDMGAPDGIERRRQSRRRADFAG